VGIAAYLSVLKIWLALKEYKKNTEICANYSVALATLQML
jgi:hypothetical protein